MAFTTQTFIFVAFPIFMTVYFLALFLQKKGVLSVFLRKIRLRDLALIGISACFYMWACFDDIFRFLAYILLIYILGRTIEFFRPKNYFIVARNDGAEEKHFSLTLPLLWLAAIIAVAVLVHFKYMGLLTDAWNYFFKDTVSKHSIVAPLGISFITFSAISYLADVYKGKAKAGNLIDLSLYLLFFPKVVSGPIVLWRDFHGQIPERRVSLGLVSDGVNRMMIGFVKKLILADTFGACIASVSSAIDLPTAWGVALLYMLQIYYDFSGYSDIAIGLSNILGFSVQENFNFPYLSVSITEFWRRWHISLGVWFREYVYFPLGGSRYGKTRTVLNVAIVFLLTGIWHGAGVTYMLWGAINGVCNIVEKLISDKEWYKKTPVAIKWICTATVTFFCWELFRFSDFSACAEWFRIMFGLKGFSSIPYTWQYYFDSRMITLALVGILGATLFGLPKIQDVYRRFLKKTSGYVIYQLITIVLFIVSLLFMVNSTYSPFIYFQY